MNADAKPFDVVALTVNLPDHNMWRGQVGTVVETMAPSLFEVEFSDDDGRTYGLLTLRADQLMVLYHSPRQVA